MARANLNTVLTYGTCSLVQVLVFFTWVIRGVADSVSMWDAVERIATFVKNVPEEADIASTSSLAALADGIMPSNTKSTPGTDGNPISLVEVKIEDMGIVNGSPPEGWPSKGDVRYVSVDFNSKCWVGFVIEGLGSEQRCL